MSTLSLIVILQKLSRRLQDSARYASISLHLSIKNLVKSWRRSHGDWGFLRIETAIAPNTPQLILDFPVMESLNNVSKVEGLRCHGVQKSERGGFCFLWHHKIAHILPDWGSLTDWFHSRPVTAQLVFFSIKRRVVFEIWLSWLLCSSERNKDNCFSISLFAASKPIFPIFLSSWHVCGILKMYFTLHVKDKYTVIFRNISVFAKNSTDHYALEGSGRNPFFHFSLKCIPLREGSAQFTATHGEWSHNSLQFRNRMKQLHWWFRMMGM